MKNRSGRRSGMRLQPSVKIRGRRKCFSPLRAAFSRISSLFADQQRNVVAPLSQKVGQLRAQASGGKIGEPAHIVHFFVSWTSSDNTVHNVTNVVNQQSH